MTAASALVLFLAAARAVPGPAPVVEPATKVVRRLEPEELLQGKLPYLLYRPPGYDRSSEAWPLLVYLHGARGLGTDPRVLFKYPIPRLVEAGRHPVPFLVLVPQCPPGRSWTEAEGLLPLIDEIATEYRVDPERIYLAGQSMGAEGVWHAAYRSPDRFAAIAPMSGEASPLWAERLVNTPVWVFHGVLDPLVPVSFSDQMVEELERQGADRVRYTRAPDRHHQPPTEAELVELLDWFLEQRLATDR